MHLEVLTKEAKQLFPKLEAFSDFYLAGGTAIALQLGHRISVDFDFFSATKLPISLLEKAEQTFEQTLQPLVNNSTELTFIVKGVKITFLEYPFPIIEPKVSLGKITGLNLLELAATKAYTIGRRGSFKDYVDIYYIVSGGHGSLEQIINLSEQKYNSQFNSRLFLEQLIYMKDITDTAITFLLPEVSKADIEEFFKECIKNLKI